MALHHGSSTKKKAIGRCLSRCSSYESGRSLKACNHTPITQYLANRESMSGVLTLMVCDKIEWALFASIELCWEIPAIERGDCTGDWTRVCFTASFTMGPLILIDGGILLGRPRRCSIGSAVLLGLGRDFLPCIEKNQLMRKWRRPYNVHNQVEVTPSSQFERTHNSQSIKIFKKKLLNNTCQSLPQ